MTVDSYLAFIAYALATTVLPGPNNVLLLSAAGRNGIGKCRSLLFGIWSGLVTVMLLAGIFLSVLDRFVPQITPVFKYIGAAYILWLAWKTWRRPPVGEGDSDDTDSLRFRDGFLLQFLNVKVLMLGLAAFPGFFLTEGNTWPRAALVPLFAVSMTVCCGTGNLIWTLAGSIIRPVYNRFYRAVNLFMALLLVWCAVKILLIGR
ncbi:MAG: LysE family transporter [Lachnospiraceae bacterium]|nr:LysE family transporter [Lachnospiraceae bacterium]